MQKILDKKVDNKMVFGATCCVKGPTIDWCGISGNFRKDDPFFIASVTKLFITAIILVLKERQKLALDDRISKYLPTEILSDLHIYKGQNYSQELTIEQLMAHTSGLPDYFAGKRADGLRLQKQLLNGFDQKWSFNDVISWIKEMHPQFEPGQNGKAFYSDTNYQILGFIIEKIWGDKLVSVIDELLVQPLDLRSTYLFMDIEDKRPKEISYKDRTLQIPLAMSSSGADGGVVSTSADLMKFLQAFFAGTLFPKSYLPELQIWNRIFYPLESGIGLMRYKLPWIFRPFKPSIQLIGYSGMSGAFAFYYPLKEVYLTGTVNQASNSATSFRLMLKLLSVVLKELA